MLSVGRLATCSLFCRPGRVDGADGRGQRKHMALCVVGPDMSRLSIDGSYLSKRGACGFKSVMEQWW